MVALVRIFIFVGSIFILPGCDHFGGPSVRNEFPNEIRVSVKYADGTKYSGTWPSCASVGIGQNEVGRFGVRPKNVALDEIIVESNGLVVQQYGRTEIDNLIKLDKKAGFPYWVINREGIKFSYSAKCSLVQGGN